MRVEDESHAGLLSLLSLIYETRADAFTMRHDFAL